MNVYVYAILNSLTFGLLNNIRWTPDLIRLPSIVEDKIREGVRKGYYVYTDCRDCNLHNYVIKPLTAIIYGSIVISYILMAVTLGLPVLINTIISKGKDVMDIYDVADNIVELFLKDGSPIIKKV